MPGSIDRGDRAHARASFDYVIVGGGAAGCVLAARLTEDPGVTVCLLESGPRDTNPFIRVPAGVIKLIFNPRIAWQFQSEPSAGTNQRSVFIPQGKTLGGSSSINGMIYNRGLPSDYDAWEKMGNPGWGFASVLPFFKKSERRIGGDDSAFRNRSGALPVSDSTWTIPPIQAFLKGVWALGLPKNPDYNGASQGGAGYMQRVIEDERRVSASRAFLKPALRRPNLTVRTEAHATRILFDGTRAIGVRYAEAANRSVSHEVFARREVIVSAGALNTPKLLQLSGVGPAALLNSLNIPVVLDRPAVGENLQDHYVTRTVVRIKNSRTANNLARWPWLGFEILRWLRKKPSILGLSSSLVYVFCRSDRTDAEPDLQMVLTPISFKAGLFGVLDSFPGMSLAVWAHRPRSTGYVRIKSTDAFQDPAIQPNYLADEYDRRVHVAGVRLTREYLATPEMQHYVEAESVPGKDVTSDEAILDYARQTGSTVYHLCGTCRMGAADDASTVVGPDLKVHGLTGLRVVDASVMPLVPSGNTYAGTLMIAEKAADMIRAARMQEACGTA